MKWLCILFVCFISLPGLAQSAAHTTTDSVAYIKIRKGIITFKKNPPPEDVRVYITVKMQHEKDGNYKITYKKGTATMYDLEKKKWTTPAAAVGEVIGGLIVLTLTVISIASRF